MIKSLDELDEMSPKELLDHAQKLKDRMDDCKRTYKRYNAELTCVHRRLQFAINSIESSIIQTEMFRTDEIPREAFVRVGDTLVTTYIEDDLMIN